MSIIPERIQIPLNFIETKYWNMTDLSSQISLITSKLNEQLATLESEYQRWSVYKTDYDALENQLKTLPDNTTQSAMIPLGKLAFMPGKLIHTNEILVLLGDQYYAERSAKQAIEILGRRREVVDENLRLAEAQLNSFKAKKSTIMESGALSSDPQINEEGLPIMEIHEELPPIDEKEEQKKQQLPQPQQRTLASNQLPESVLRARQMMKEADEKINENRKAEQDVDNKALFDLLRELEEEEEEEEEDQSQVIPPVPTTVVNKKIDNVEEADDDELDSEEEFSDDDDRYDTEISDNMFDRFGDDEQYPLDGVVDQEDFTYYEEDEDRSTPKIITKKKTHKLEDTLATTVKEKPSTTKIVAASIKEVPIAPVKEGTMASETPTTKKSIASTVKETPIEATSYNVKNPKKFSKFKLLRQEQKERPNIKPPTEDIIQRTIKEEVPITIDTDEHQFHDVKPLQNQSVPEVATKPKKMSRFKRERTQSKETSPKAHLKQDTSTEAPLTVERIKPKRSVTWDTNTDVRDHDKAAAPSDIASTASYSQPMKTTSNPANTKIRTPADIFRQLRPAEDDYPSLDDDIENDQNVDLNELIKVARDSQEAFYRPTDGTEALIPMVKSTTDNEDGIIIAPKSKLDNKIMKGAVMERDVVPVDLEEVEDDMDLREVMANYQKKRQEMLAVSGGFSFATKPEFEVFDEELPLPKKKQQQQQQEGEEEEEEVKPKKLSRFKAARLGMRMDNDDY